MAEQLFKNYLIKSPGNILAHYFLSKCYRANGNWRGAKNSLVAAIRIGERRRPPLKLIRIRLELSRLRNSKPGLLGAVRRFFNPPGPDPHSLPSEEAERRALERTINRLARKQPTSKSARGYISGPRS